MKKIISSILCISLLVTIICIPVSATEEAVATENIEEFCDDLNEMVAEHSDSAFVTPDFTDEEQAEETIPEDFDVKYCPRLIVQSDVDGDSAVDTLDLASIEKTVNGHEQLEGCYYMAADFNRNNELTVEDYSQAVNFALAV